MLGNMPVMVAAVALVLIIAAALLLRSDYRERVRRASLPADKRWPRALLDSRPEDFDEDVSPEACVRDVKVVAP